MTDTDYTPHFMTGNLGCRLLERDPARRISLDKALASPWLHDLTAPSSQPLNLLVVDRILQFAAFTPLQRLLLNLTTSCQQASSHRQHLQNLFDDLVSIFNSSTCPAYKVSRDL